MALLGLLIMGLSFHSNLATNRVGNPRKGTNNPKGNSKPGDGAPPKPTTTTTSTTTTSTTTTTTTIPAPTEPGGGYTLIPGRTVVAFYGAPGGGGLGVLGQKPPEAMWQQLMEQVAPYQQLAAQVLPAYELITFVAQGSPQANGTYSARLSNAEIQKYLDVIREHHGLLILDIQPGRGNFLADAQTLTPFLSQPDVGLALDPEWRVGADQIPGKVIGSATAVEINQVSSWLEQLVTANHLPQKLLLIHEFTGSMIQNKADVAARPNLATVFNMDGFGSWKAKLSSYKLLAEDKRFPLGFKLFYKQDVPLESPSKVMALDPQPVIVEYE